MIEKLFLEEWSISSVSFERDVIQSRSDQSTQRKTVRKNRIDIYRFTWPPGFLLVFKAKFSDLFRKDITERFFETNKKFLKKHRFDMIVPLLS